MFSQIMFVLKALGRRLCLRINPLTLSGHLRHFFQYHRIMHCVKCVGSPCKGPVVFAEYAGNCHTIQFSLLKDIRNQNTRIQLIILIQFFLGQIPDTWNTAVNIVRMGCSIAWNITSRLSPGCGPRTVSVYNSAGSQAHSPAETPYPPIWGKRLYSSRWVLVSEEGFRSPSTLFPFKSITTISSGFNLS